MVTDLDKIEGFEWDEGNKEKNFRKHGITNKECEEVLDNEPILISLDKAHSSDEEMRYQVLGKTDPGKKLFLSFTIRNNKIRIISARDMSKTERRIYNEEESKKN